MTNPDKINKMILDTLESGKIKINDAATLVKVMEFQQKYLENKCSVCPYKMNAERPLRSISEALQDFLADDEDTTKV